MGPEEAVKETFHQVIKMAILFGGVAFLYVWFEAIIFKKAKKKKLSNKK